MGYALHVEECCGEDGKEVSVMIFRYWKFPHVSQIFSYSHRDDSRLNADNSNSKGRAMDVSYIKSVKKSIFGG